MRTETTVKPGKGRVRPFESKPLKCPWAEQPLSIKKQPLFIPHQQWIDYYKDSRTVRCVFEKSDSRLASFCLFRFVFFLLPPPAFRSSIIVSASQFEDAWENDLTHRCSPDCFFFLSLAQRGRYIIHSMRCRSQHLSPQWFDFNEAQKWCILPLCAGILRHGQWGSSLIKQQNSCS